MCITDSCHIPTHVHVHMNACCHLLEHDSLWKHAPHLLACKTSFGCQDVPQEHERWSLKGTPCACQLLTWYWYSIWMRIEHSFSNSVSSLPGVEKYERTSTDDTLVCFDTHIWAICTLHICVVSVSTVRCHRRSMMPVQVLPCGAGASYSKCRWEKRGES